ncbi:hypothetical protein DSO57_1038384 [Entomophthora muscae]|uniref:Uncharacterized protein n=1 Tax=Entomophthora muscae TaxID=34485 RepID=A0ACC2SC89_9FUNG|nr:hypothetical protein DSO57_1038384 [Entomophthora muscae]
MNHLIFTAVLTACLGIGGYQSGPEFFGPSPKGLGQHSYYDPGQLNSSQTGPWPPLVSPPFNTLHCHVHVHVLCLDLLRRKFWEIQCACQDLLLAHDCVPHCYHLDWVIVCQPATLLPASDTYHNWALHMGVVPLQPVQSQHNVKLGKINDGALDGGVQVL